MIPGLRTFRHEEIREPDQSEAEGREMADESVYRVIDVVGTSSESWEAAARTAIETAAGSLRDLRVAEVTKLDVSIDDGKIVRFRTRLNLSFKYEG